MITVRRAKDRGHANYGWLDTNHTFSFSGYYDPDHMGFRALRVINEDRVAPGKGFGMHGHKEMEIISYVIDGELEHKDSMGNGSVIQAGGLQRISAGTGIRHSEFNPSSENPVHFYQIWLEPNQRGVEPGYEERQAGGGDTASGMQLLASADAREGSMKIHQDADVYLLELDSGGEASFKLQPGRYAWIQTTHGSVEVNDAELSTGDGAAVVDESILSFSSAEGAKVLLFDLA